MSAGWIVSAFTLLLDTAWRAAVLTGLVGLVLTAARAKSSTVRHRAWCLALVAMLLMPALSAMAPKFELPIAAPAGVAAGTPDVDRPMPPGSAPLPPGTGPAVPMASVPASAGPATPQPPVQAVGARAVVVPALLLLYAIGVVWGLGRLALGWAAAVRLVRGATPAGIGDALESAAVATPVTVGVLRSRIVLPAGWRTWPSDRLRAILAHERAHVDRQDPLVAFIARVNRSLFWFHPAAWWIERRLAAEAEHACDAAGVKAIGTGRDYAAVLLDMADIVRRHGGRVIQPSLGVEGSGLLGRRIDRVLRGPLEVATTRRRKIVVAAGCAAAVAIAVSCTRQAEPVQPLRENPDVARRAATYRANEAIVRRTDTMTLADLSALEASLQKDSKNVESWKTLKWFYLRRGQALLGWNEMTRRRLPYVTMLIDEMPDSPESVWRVTDSAGYAAAASAWRAHSSAPSASTAVLANAAQFFGTRDFPEAERLLLRARASDPSSADRWSRRLGELYAGVILGERSQQDGHPTTAFDNDPSARDVFTRLLASTDANLVGSAGAVVIRGSYFDSARAALGRQLVDRALSLDPAQVSARQVLLASEQSDRMKRLRVKQAELAGLGDKVQRGEQLAPEEFARLQARALEAARTLPERERMWALLEVPERLIMWAEYLAGSSKDATAIADAWQQSKEAATQALELAPAFRDRPENGSAIYRANVALGLHALREGHRAEAVRYMRAAAAAPRSELLAADPSPGLSIRLVNYLLKEGERESVVEFLEKSAELRTVERQRLLADAAAVRAGEMPTSYQYVMARR